jgi:antitoxin VapB
MPRSAANSNSAEAKLFWNGRSQAVRLPKEFRFTGDRVRVKRVGKGVLLEPFAERHKQTVEHIDALRGDPILPRERKGSVLVAAMQASPYKELGLELERLPMPVREVRF